MVRYQLLCGESGGLSENGVSEDNYSDDGYSDNGYLNVPYAWVAPDTFTVAGATLTPYASPFNPNEVGIGAHARNEAEREAEIDKQQGSIKSAYWNAFITGIISGLPGVGPVLAAQNMAGGTPSYPFEIEDRDLKPRFNPEDTGIAPLAANENAAADEVENQGGYDWSLLLPANWLKTVREFLAAQEAAKEGGSIPVTMSDDIKAAGGKAVEKAEDAANAGKSIIDGFNAEAGSPFSWFGTSTGMMALGVGGLVLLILIIK